MCTESVTREVRRFRPDRTNASDDRIERDVFVGAAVVVRGDASVLPRRLRSANFGNLRTGPGFAVGL